MIAEKNFRILRGERAFLIAREMDLFRLSCLREAAARETARWLLIFFSVAFAAIVSELPYPIKGCGFATVVL